MAEQTSAKVLHITSGQVLESKATPNTLEQKDYQGSAMTHDLMTQDGLTETENSNKTTQYAANVNSTLTECAPNISKTYQQNKSYSETYKTKTETISAQNYTRTTTSPQYTKSQNNLNLSIPNTLNNNATKSINRTVNERNAIITHHNMSSNTHNAQYGTLVRNGNVTYMKVNGHLQFRANNFQINAGPQDAPVKPIAPRRAPPNMIAKVSGTFASKTISLPPAYNEKYVIQIDFTVTGEYEMESINSVNPSVMSKEKFDAEVKKNLGNYFEGMQVNKAINTSVIEENDSPTFIIGNQYGSYSLSDGLVFVVPSKAQQAFIIKYSTSISAEKKLVNEWLLTLIGSIEAKVIMFRKNILNKAEISTENMIQEANIYLREHINDSSIGLIIRGLKTYARPTIEAMYGDSEALYSYNIADLALVAL